MTDRLFYGALIGFAAGIFVASFADYGFVLPILFLLIALSCAVLWKVGERRPLLLVCSIVFLAAALGVFRFSFEESAPPQELAEYVGQTLSVSGFIVREPTETDRSQRIVLSTESFEVGDGRVAVKTRVITTLPRHPQLSYGDRLTLSGVLQEPERFETDSGRIFDYPAYLAKDDIFYTMYFPEVMREEGTGGNVIKRGLFSLKSVFLERLGRVIPEPHVSLLGGLLVGVQESLGDDLLDVFRTVGIIHIIVLSGYNVTLVAEALMRFFGFLPRTAKFALGGIAIVLFAVLVGATATVVRASLMALLVIVARVAGRPYAALRGLMVAGFIMVLVHPSILAFDPSFQLSFLATLGLIVLSPLIQRRLGWVPSRYQMRELAAATISTQLFVLPLLLYMVGEVSTVALFVNMLVLPVVPLAMLLGFITGTVGLVASALSVPFGYITTLVLGYILSISELFAGIPFATLSVSVFPFWAVVVLYGVYGIVLWRVQRTAVPRRVAGDG